MNMHRPIALLLMPQSMLRLSLCNRKWCTYKCHCLGVHWMYAICWCSFIQNNNCKMLFLTCLVF